MKEIEEKGQGKSVSEEFTRDGTVDLKGRPVLRSKGGRWTACFFIVGTHFPTSNCSTFSLIYMFFCNAQVNYYVTSSISFGSRSNYGDCFCCRL